MIRRSGMKQFQLAYLTYHYFEDQNHVFNKSLPRTHLRLQVGVFGVLIFWPSRTLLYLEIGRRSRSSKILLKTEQIATDGWIFLWSMVWFPDSDCCFKPVLSFS